MLLPNKYNKISDSFRARGETRPPSQIERTENDFEKPEKGIRVFSLLCEIESDFSKK